MTLKKFNGYIIILYLGGLLTGVYALNFLMLVIDPVMHNFYIALINARVSKDAEVKTFELLPSYFTHLEYWFFSVNVVAIIASVLISRKNKRFSINIYIALLLFLFCGYLNYQNLPGLKYFPAIIPVQIFTWAHTELYLLINGLIFSFIAGFFFYSLFKINKANKD
jgi:hypothetical protein